MKLIALSCAAFLIATACGQVTATSSQVASEPRVSSPVPSTAEAPVGTAVAAQVLPPAMVLPAVPLCTTPVQVYQDGNAGPLLCSGGAVNVAAWQWFEKNLQPPVMAAGPALSADAQRAALCRVGPQNMTVPEAESAYWLAAAYYGWTPIDAERVLVVEGCR